MYPPVLQCCADETGFKSDRSCSALNSQAQAQYTTGPNAWVLRAGEPVCATSALPYGVDGLALAPTNEDRCFANESLAFAEHICASNGARLCTKFELQTAAQSTGTLRGNKPRYMYVSLDMLACRMWPRLSVRLYFLQMHD